jgi:hypothetical protein
MRPGKVSVLELRVSLDIPGRVSVMPYEISLDRDPENGLDRYTIVLGPGFARADSRELSDWLLAAAQNPTASFAIDTSNGPEPGPELAAALAVVGAEDLARLGYAKS